jgi:DNA uptake protein ComE-like DNA-binding protein
MKTNQLHVYGIVVCTAISFAALSGCTKNDRTAENNARNSENHEEVISRQVTPMDQAGGTAVKKDDQELHAKQETVTKKTEMMNEKVPTVVQGQQKLDVNRMGKDDFAALGLDKATADRIIERRDQKGSFASINDLSGIEGVSPEWLNRYRDRFAFVSKDGDSQKAGEAGNH